MAATGAPAGDWPDLLTEQVVGAVAGGVDVVQLREPDLDDRQYVRLVRQLVHVLEGTPARIVVNERLDIALAGGAHGVHLRETSIGADAVRRLTSRAFLVGRSVHGIDAAVRVESADYLIAGSVFATRSKPGLPARLGLEGLAAVVHHAAGRPVWAVGGVNADRLRAVAAAGARGVAAIDAFIPIGPVERIRDGAQKCAEAMRFCFDSTAELF